MRTTVAGSVRRRLAMARTLNRTYSRGCSRMGRIISWRFALSCSIRSGRLTAGLGVESAAFFMPRENCSNPFRCQRGMRYSLGQTKRIRSFLRRRCFRVRGQPRRYDGLKERHHGAELGTQLLDGMGLFAMSRGQEVRAAFFVFLDPFLGEAAITNLGKNFAHFLAGLRGNDPRAGGVVALLGGVADGIAHVAEAAAVDEV